MVVAQVHDVAQAAVDERLLAFLVEQVKGSRAEEPAGTEAAAVRRPVAPDVTQVRYVVEPDEAAVVVFSDVLFRVGAHEKLSCRTRLRLMKSWFRPTPMPGPSGMVWMPSSAFSMRSVMSSSQ